MGGAEREGKASIPQIRLPVQLQDRFRRNRKERYGKQEGRGEERDGGKGGGGGAGCIAAKGHRGSEVTNVEGAVSV